jgi:hypothetical protein
MKWKSGDVTWMPYYQITHLKALESYFKLLGVEKIEDLPGGTASDSHQDPQVFLGGLSLASPTAMNGLNTGPSPTTTSCTHSTPSTRTHKTEMSEYGFDFNHTLLTRDGRDHWHLLDPTVVDRHIHYTSHQIRDFIHYDQSLHESNDANQPGGYHEFINTFNDPLGNCYIKFTSVAGVVIPGTPPDIHLFKVDPMTLCSCTARMHTSPWKSHSKPTNPCLASPHTVETNTSAASTTHSDGGMTLSPYEADITCRLLIHTAGQVVRHDRAIAEWFNNQTTTTPYSTSPDGPKQHKKKGRLTTHTRETSPNPSRSTSGANSRAMSIDQ